MKFVCLSALPLLVASALSGAVVEYDLTIAEQKLPMAGKPVRALTINGTVPGPTLRFREGDFARIRVHNALKHEETSTHWHGILLPNKEDGVPYITTPPILPGETYTFQFKIRQAGTYWYHSHTHLQEQIGVYGSIVIEPRGGEPVKADREEVVVLSDWTNENPDEVLRTLVRGSDYYALKKGNAQSILGAIKAGALKDYVGNAWSRMPPMDVSDVAYDAFLINGKQRSHIKGRPGERIRLRVINSAASTYFYVKWAAGPMTIVAADGPPVEPVKIDRLILAIAETYDIIVTVPPSGAYEFRATSQDGSGHASLFIGSGEEHPADDPPKPNVYSMEEMMDTVLAEEEDDKRAELKLPRPGPPYRILRSPHATTLPKSAPVREITMRLTGDMKRYVWSFDNKTVAQEPYVPLKYGEVLRIELVNDTMMHHPIHLHGHFFRVLNGQGARSPLKHTVDVPPMGKRVIEFEANEGPGDWMFHCHILYHMMAGMTRLFTYEDHASQVHGQEPGHGKKHEGHLGEHSHDMWYFWGEGSLQSHMSEGMATYMNARNDLMVDWEIGWENVDDTQYEIDLLYQRYFNADWQAFVGARLTNEEDAENRAVIGVNYRLPLLAYLNVSLDSEGDARFSLAKRLQLTSRLSAFARVEYDTNTEWEWTTGAEFVVNKPVSLITQYHSEYGFGAGLNIRF
jgi:FtsP/CotA-like multicopper oxidase with cupredoxin domain